MRAVLASGVLLAVAASSLTACAHENDGRPTPAETGASPTAHRAQCVVADPDGELILHPGSFTPDGPTTTEDATLDSPVNLRVLERDVVRFTGRSTVQGIVLDYPPLKTAGLADSLADWDARRPLAGLGLDTADGQQAVLVAVRLADPRRPGHLRGVTLTTDRGETAYAQPVLVKPHGEPCTVADYDSTLDWVG